MLCVYLCVMQFFCPFFSQFITPQFIPQIAIHTAQKKKLRKIKNPTTLIQNNKKNTKENKKTKQGKIKQKKWHTRTRFIKIVRNKANLKFKLFIFLRENGFKKCF